MKEFVLFFFHFAVCDTEIPPDPDVPWPPKPVDSDNDNNDDEDEDDDDDDEVVEPGPEAVTDTGEIWKRSNSTISDLEYDAF